MTVAEAIPESRHPLRTAYFSKEEHVMVLEKPAELVSIVRQGEQHYIPQMTRAPIPRPHCSLTMGQRGHCRHLVLALGSIGSKYPTRALAQMAIQPVPSPFDSYGYMLRVDIELNLLR